MSIDPALALQELNILDRQLLKDLKKLLQKHQARIYFRCNPENDTSGLTDDVIVVNRRGKVIKIVESWVIDSADL